MTQAGGQAGERRTRESVPARAPGGLGSIVLAARDIKLAHSVFALPFAVLAAFLARDPAAGWDRFAGQLGLVVVCMVAARTWAMLFNRLVDRGFDAANPRTAGRAVASGALGVGRAWGLAAGSAALFVACAGLFGVLFANWWPVVLSVPVLAWIAFYSLTKRFTLLCHVFLGGALAASPLAAAVAIEAGSLVGVGSAALWWLGAMVLLWVAGFDVVYALQDIEFDRSAGLRSVPARLGWRGAAWAARGLHVFAAAALVMAWVSEPRFGLVFGAAVVVVLGVLALEHVVLARRGERGLEMAFFTLNGVVSCVLGAAGVVDVVV
ncbi:MAG: 4-hydroxybenzoate octaprenyltransferase [Phycisphaeraceae bacterium]|nr:4-hydroxybenzoate octaprenyltransferase [Phycisphaeraceae bacterium]